MREAKTVNQIIIEVNERIERRENENGKVE